MNQNEPEKFSFVSCIDMKSQFPESSDGKCSELTPTPSAASEPISLDSPRLRPLLSHALLALLPALLASCGGGGGGGGGGPDPDACFKISDGNCLTNTELGRRARELAAEFKVNYNKTFRLKHGSYANHFQWGLDTINADDAFAHLALVKGRDAAGMPGKGVTIGFVDSGIRKQHEAFDLTSSVTEEILLGAVDEGPIKFSHGTAVASIAAGKYGVARAANIKMFAIPTTARTGPSITLNQLSAIDFRNLQLSEYVLNQNIDIMNFSIAYPGSIEDYSEQDLRNNFGRTIRALAQTGEQEKTILVWAAGNEGNSSPEILAGLVARISELQGHSLAVVSIGEDGTIAGTSSRCGIAAAFCIAAPGERVGVAHSGNDRWGVASGTSFAAPYVSGSLAVMKQMFRDQLSNEQLVSRLFSTAKDDGIYANSAIYGHGLLDLGAATNPWGVPGLMGTQSSATGTGASLDTSFMSLGAPWGTAFLKRWDPKRLQHLTVWGLPSGTRPVTSLSQQLVLPSQPTCSASLILPNSPHSLMSGSSASKRMPLP